MPASVVARRLSVLAIVSILLTGGLYVVTVGTSVGQLVGELILGGRPDPGSVSAATELLGTVSRPALVVGTIVLGGWALMQERPRLALVVVVVVIGANVTTQLAKDVLLDRPDQLDGLFYPLANSFPSGHATAVASLAVSLLLVAPPFLRTPIAIPASVLVALVGVSTIALGWHRMADAVGGTLVATTWAASAAAVLAWRRGVEPVGRRATSLGRAGSRLLVGGGVALLVVGWLAYLVAALDPLGVLLVLADRGGSPAMFLIGVAIVIGASFAALGALAFSLKEVRLDPREPDVRRGVLPRPQADAHGGDAGHGDHGGKEPGAR